MRIRKSLGAFSLVVVSSALGAVDTAASGQDELVVIKDEEGNPLSMADAVGQEIRFVYDELGQVVATVDQDGVVTDWKRLFEEAGGGDE